jgi:hypothetical protein
MRGPRRIDPAFTELMIVAVGLLPGMAPFTCRIDIEAVTAAARASAELPRWPTACIQLLEACEEIAAGTKDALRAGEIGAAASCEWPAPVASWQRRADIGEEWPEDDGERTA